MLLHGFFLYKPLKLLIMRNTFKKSISELLVFRILVVLFVLLFLYFVFLPGLAGNFMLDDYSSLPILFSNIESCGVWCGVLSGSTGPTGRPISLLSFALQASFWPDAYWFKVVNLVLHLINTFLLFLVFQCLLRRLNPTLPTFYIALVSACLWSVWPLQISSVLYVIQRMVLLSSFFVLSAIVFYLFCRVRLENEWFGQFSKWFFMCLGLAVLGVSAVYSKESGVLLLVYISVIEGLFFRKKLTNTSSLRNKEKDIYVIFFRYGGLAFPLCVFLLYLLIKYIGDAEYLYMTREFTLEERVMTQGRVMVDYLQSLFFPRPSQLGLYHDSYTISKSLFQPISTSVSWLLILFLLGTAYFARRNYILLSAAIFWFFGGHLLESTVVSLELYFEHRNYLPVALLTLALVCGAYQLFMKLSSQLVRAVFFTVVSLYCLMVVSLTFSQVGLWGDELEYGLVQAHEHPESVRARSLSVDVYNKLGHVDIAYLEFQKMQKDFPDISGMIVGDVEFACYDEKYPLAPLNEVVPKLKSAKYGYGAMVTINETLREISNGECKNVTLEYLYELNNALKFNPPYSRKMHVLLKNEVIILTMLNKLDEAVNVYSKMNLGPEHWPRYISLLARLGRLNEALMVANEAVEVLKKQPQYSFYYKDVIRFKEILESDLQTQ